MVQSPTVSVYSVILKNWRADNSLVYKKQKKKESASFQLGGRRTSIPHQMLLITSAINSAQPSATTLSTQSRTLVVSSSAIFSRDARVDEVN